MWCLQLLELLAGDICPADKKNAVSFIKRFFYRLSKDHYDGKLEPLMVFGFMIDLYKYSVSQSGKEILLSEFAQKCLGLAVLHAKCADDAAFYCSDFIDTISDDRIYSALNIDDEVHKLFMMYLDGSKYHKDMLTLSDIDDQDTFLHYRDLSIKIAMTDIIKRIEKETFFGLDHVVKTCINELVSVLNDLLNRVENQSSVLADLYTFIKPLKNKSPIFDSFINAINRTWQQTIFLERAAHQNFYTRRIYEYTETTPLINYDSDESDDSDGKPLFIPSLKVKINLILIPPLDFSSLPRNNPEIMNVCNQLEQYARATSKYSRFFKGSSHRHHREEIAEISNQIRKGHFCDLQSILIRLKDIKLIDPQDKLVAIINKLEAEESRKSSSMAIKYC